MRGHIGVAEGEVSNRLWKKNSKPAGINLPACRKRGEVVLLRNVLRGRDQASGTDAVQHEPWYNYQGYYSKVCQKKQEESRKK